MLLYVKASLKDLLAAEQAVDLDLSHLEELGIKHLILARGLLIEFQVSLVTQSTLDNISRLLGTSLHRILKLQGIF